MVPKRAERATGVDCPLTLLRVRHEFCEEGRHGGDPLRPAKFADFVDDVHDFLGAEHVQDEFPLDRAGCDPLDDAFQLRVASESAASPFSAGNRGAREPATVVEADECLGGRESD